MPVARPRKITLPPEEMIAMGEEMIAFVSDPERKVLSLSEFYTVHKGFTYAEWKNMHVAAEFYPYYEQALRIIGKKYLDGTINPSIAQRYLRRYDAELREQEDSDLKYKAELDKESKKEEASNAIESMSKVFDQISKAREELSQRKSSCDNETSSL